MGPPLFVVSLGVVLALGCGPNYRYVYDGDAAFERCYAADFDHNASPIDRTSCWHSWLADFTYGANTERVDYARARVAHPDVLPGTASHPGELTTPGTSSLPDGPAPPSGSAVGTATGSPSVGGLLSAVPQPVPPVEGGSQTTPPGISTDPTEGGRISAGGNPITAPAIVLPATVRGPSVAPGSACATGCLSAWNTATAQCPPNTASCIVHTDDRYRECMHGCF